MSNSLEIEHLQKLKNRLSLEQPKATSTEMSALEKVDTLEKTLSIFRAEVDMKLKIMQQILSTRNEQVSAQKKLLEKEQLLYDTLLDHWRKAPNLAATGHTGHSVNIKEEVESDGVENQSDADYQEEQWVDFSPEPRQKKSRSALRRQRSSAKSTMPNRNELPDAYLDVDNFHHAVETENNIPPASSSEWEDDGQELQNPPVFVQIDEVEEDDDHDFSEFHQAGLPKENGQTWYETLLGHWESKPNLATVGLPVNLSVASNFNAAGGEVQLSAEPGSNPGLDLPPPKPEQPPPPGVSYTLWCGLCSKQFNNRAAKSNHMMGHRPGGRPRLQCRSCNQTFSKEYARKRHQRKQNH